MTLKADLMIYLSKVRGRIVTVGKFNEGYAANYGSQQVAEAKAETQYDLEEVDDLSMRLSHMSTFSDAEHPDTDKYVAANLLAHIDKMPDTGDWHGILKNWARQNESNHRPNGCSCSRMLDGGIMPRPKGFPTPLTFDDDCLIHGEQKKTITLDVDLIKGFVEGDPAEHHKAEQELRSRLRMDDNKDWRAGSDYYPKG